MIDGVHIWRAALDDPGWPGPEELPPQEGERAAAFLREEAAKRWVAARWALRQVLGHYVGEDPAGIELEIGEYGKPRLRGGPRFNLSHSEGIALVAVCDREVGVDVEAVKPQARRPAALCVTWTRYEARVKCIGTGLGSPPPPVEVTVADLDVGQSYAAAVAVAGSEIGPLRLRTLNTGNSVS